MVYQMQIQSTKYIILVYWIQMQGTEYNFGLVINTNAKHWIKFWFIKHKNKAMTIIFVHWMQMQITDL